MINKYMEVIAIIYEVEVGRPMKEKNARILLELVESNGLHETNAMDDWFFNMWESLLENKPIPRNPISCFRDELQCFIDEVDEILPWDYSDQGEVIYFALKNIPRKAVISREAKGGGYEYWVE